MAASILKSQTSADKKITIQSILLQNKVKSTNSALIRTLHLVCQMSTSYEKNTVKVNFFLQLTPQTLVITRLSHDCCCLCHW